MTTLEINGDWNITKGKLKQKWARLTDDDLQYAEGRQEELIGRIQKRTGETREAVEKALKEYCSACSCNQQPRTNWASVSKAGARAANHTSVNRFVHGCELLSI